VSTPLLRPDLAIYSQLEQISSGSAPTWDSPDITSVLLPTNQIINEIVVKARNISTNCAALNGTVSLYSSIYGLGMPRNLQGQTSVTLVPQEETTVTFPLSQSVIASIPQQLGMHVSLAHPQDLKLMNNNGSQMLAAFPTSVMGSRVFNIPIQVRNPFSTPQSVNLDLMPNALSANVQPSVSLGALAQASVPVSITVPAALHGSPANPIRLDMTVVASIAGTSFFDGLTAAIYVDD
jgi:hypothetical protein